MRSSFQKWDDTLSCLAFALVNKCKINEIDGWETVVTNPKVLGIREQILDF